ncbi:type II toxin-antitoxin system RelE/ParE family toxin [Niabella sp. CJ426]|uniref:type II toxin-antitoxin system RelE/ParE family toxin n=1 Tax=Niabella sp. CJ426 TaxID=3393740 RepID=UPI003D00D31A
MAYSIVISKRAVKEIEIAIDYYVKHSSQAPSIFVQELETAYELLTHTPPTRLYYKNINGLKLKRFPYILYFLIDENKKIIKVLACFHNRRNPDLRPDL